MKILTLEGGLVEAGDTILWSGDVCALFGAILFCDDPGNVK